MGPHGWDSSSHTQARLLRHGIYMIVFAGYVYHIGRTGKTFYMRLNQHRQANTMGNRIIRPVKDVLKASNITMSDPAEAR